MIPRENFEHLVSELEKRTEEEMDYTVKFLNVDQSEIPEYERQVEIVASKRIAITKELFEKLNQEEERVISGELAGVAERVLQLNNRIEEFYTNIYRGGLKELERRGLRTVH